ncbi:MAG: hypothetical protein FJ034_06955, partial [Chloroflexi bacterium]|nr:hypothetical protein [Chloroflexota bacterium]
MRSLTKDELEALRAAIPRTLAWAAGEVERAMPAELGAKPRGHMRVRGASKTRCPRCGTALVLRHGGEKEMHFCP